MPRCGSVSHAKRKRVTTPPVESSRASTSDGDNDEEDLEVDISNFYSEERRRAAEQKARESKMLKLKRRRTIKKTNGVKKLKARPAALSPVHDEATHTRSDEESMGPWTTDSGDREAVPRLSQHQQ